jgi:hypothetical protein
MEKVRVPRPALFLWTLLTVGGLLAGLVLGSWILPVCVVLVHEGPTGLQAIPNDWCWASAPRWMEHRTGEFMKLGSGVLGLGLATLFGIGGGKLSHWLIVEKFRWMTKAEVERYNNSRPRM